MTYYDVQADCIRRKIYASMRIDRLWKEGRGKGEGGVRRQDKDWEERKTYAGTGISSFVNRMQAIVPLNRSRFAAHEYSVTSRQPSWQSLESDNRFPSFSRRTVPLAVGRQQQPVAAHQSSPLAAATGSLAPARKVISPPARFHSHYFDAINNLYPTFHAFVPTVCLSRSRFRFALSEPIPLARQTASDWRQLGTIADLIARS